MMKQYLKQAPRTSYPVIHIDPEKCSKRVYQNDNGHPLFGKIKDLPIRGRAQGGDDGNMIIEEQPIDWTFRPADLQGIHGAFAVFVTGNSMQPKYSNQDIAYIHPDKQPRSGRHVLVETAKHAGFIKQFKRWESDVLVLQQYNPEKEIRIPRAEVRRVMLVIGSIDA